MSPFIETVRIENGRIENLSYHNQRMNETRREVLQAVAALDLSAYIHPENYPGRTKCRVVYAADVQEVTYTPYQIRPVSSLRLVVADTVCYPYKSTDRKMLDDLFALRGDADDILMVRAGLLTDTSICNIALWDGLRWQTPAVPLLSGTKRASLLDTGHLRTAEIGVTDLPRYSRIRLFNAMIEFGEIEFAVALGGGVLFDRIAVGHAFL